MLTTDDIEKISEQLNDLSARYRSYCEEVRKIKQRNVDSSLIQKSEEYIKNADARTERLKSAHAIFVNEIGATCTKFMENVDSIEKEDQKEVEDLNSGFEKTKDELKNSCDMLSKVNKVPLFIYNGNVQSKIDVELVLKYPGSYLYNEYMSHRRTADGDIYMDNYDDDNDEFIVKYMNNEDEDLHEDLIDDLKKMSSEKKNKLIENLAWLKLPIKKNFVREIGRNEDNDIMEAWRERRVVLVNGQNLIQFNKLLKDNNLLDSIFNNEHIENIKYHKERNEVYINLNMKYLDMIQKSLENRNKFDKEFIKEHFDDGNVNELLHEIEMVGIQLTEEEKKEISDYYNPMFVNISNIIDNHEYDKCLRNWLGSNYKWKLLYRASEHRYTASSFHECCDDKGPTLIVIKSSVGWFSQSTIFGGYTTQSWSGDRIYHMIYE